LYLLTVHTHTIGTLYILNLINVAYIYLLETILIAMRHQSQLILLLLLITFLSCQKEDSTHTGKMTDTELINAIRDATHKQNIDPSDLPDDTKTTLDIEYKEDVVDIARLAPKLGYEVDLRKEKGNRIGDKSQVYFDIKGRFLKGDKDGMDNHGGKGKGGRCFEMIYPVTYIMPDGSPITAETNDEQGWAAVKAWYAAHPDYKKKPGIQYPVDIKWKDGTITTINNVEEMKRAKDKCGFDKQKYRCFRLIYPVTYIMPDGTGITVNTDDEDGWTEVKAWYAAHPDVKIRPDIQYPVDIKYKDGTVGTIRNQQEMRRAKKGC